MRVANRRSAVLLVACVAAGCSGAGGSRSTATVGDALASPAPLPRATAADATAPSSTDPGVTGSPPIAAVPDVPEGATALSADGPWRLVDSAPGVEGPGLVYELMPLLWVFLPYERDLAHGTVWTFRERDREVVEDWLRAMVVYHRSVTADPMTVGDDEWRTWFPVDDMPVVDLLEDRRSRGLHTELDRGKVLRPEVLGEERTDTTAIVFDCQWDGSIVVDRDGEVVPPSFRGFGEAGMGYRMALVDGSWRVTAVGSQDDACL